jgi:hypothetical protein
VFLLLAGVAVVATVLAVGSVPHVTGTDEPVERRDDHDAQQ